MRLIKIIVVKILYIFMIIDTYLDKNYIDEVIIF